MRSVPPRNSTALLPSCLLAGCLATPTPLAPQLEGSIGEPHRGVQTGADELPPSGPGYVRFRPLSPHYWGHPDLVRAIQAAAAAGARSFPGSPPLVVGDLSARNGGRIPGHSSHRSGRDVDLLWHVTGLDGTPRRSPGFIKVGPDGLAALPPTDEHVVLDVERQWLLFRELLMSPYVDVQWLFVSRDVESLLVDHALARGEPAELVWRAETTMRQPSDGAPHDDHVHVRIACSAHDAVHGCRGGGPHWEWLAAWPRLVPLTTTWLAELAHDDPLRENELPAGPEGAGHDA